MTNRMDPKTRVLIVTRGSPSPGEMTMALEELYASCSWRETGDDLALEVALKRDGKRVDDGGWRTISLLDDDPKPAAETPR